MQIGEVIRTYRKKQNLTQEEMANRLGVSAPAVNKWENGSSLPDISMLAPVARLLEITPDILLSFQEDVSQEEINQIVQEVDEKFRKEESYEDIFQFVKKKIARYPNSERLARMAYSPQTSGFGTDRRIRQNNPGMVSGRIKKRGRRSKRTGGRFPVYLLLPK